MSIGELITDTLILAKTHGVHVRFSPKLYVMTENVKCGGYFGERPYPILAVAMGHKEDRWQSLLVHESCHMDQWIEKSPVWSSTNYKSGKSALGIIYSWFEGTNYSNRVLNDAFKRAMAVEIDCEKRSVEKIKKYNLSIDIEYYTKAANSYIYSYLYMRSSRKWVGSDYSLPCIINAAPASFQTDYITMPEELSLVYKQL